MVIAVIAAEKLAAVQRPAGNLGGNLKIIAIIACVAGAALFAPLMEANAQCVLKIEPLRNRQECLGFVGYSNGKRVGPFHTQGKNVVAGGKCPADRPRGKKVRSNAIQVNGVTFTLAPDCLSSTVSQ